MIKKIAVFHFANGYENPVGELAMALERVGLDGRDSDALVVLPEGFNLGRKYGEHRDEIAGTFPMFDAHCMVQLLSGLARAQSLTFIVGLIEVDPATRRKSNRAYFVDGSGKPRLLCRKIDDDGLVEYEPYKVDCEGENPIEVGGLRLGALLCMDAERQPERNCEVAKIANARRETLLANLRNHSKSVLCIPGAFTMERCWCKGQELLGVGVLVANSIAGCTSQVVDCHGECFEMPDANDNYLFSVEVERVIDQSQRRVGLSPAG